jgi:Protein of unknown function (DUF2786)
MASDNVLLERVRKFLAKAESAGVTGPEALTARAAELMARCGIDRTLLAAARPAVWHRDVPLSHLPRGAGILLAAGTALAPWPDCFPLGGSRK